MSRAIKWTKTSSADVTMSGHGCPECPIKHMGKLIHQAVYDEHTFGFNSVEMLAVFAAPMNIKNTDNYTPLHVAVQISSMKMVKSLLKYGADVRCIGGAQHRTPLDMAVQFLCKLDIKVKAGILLSRKELWLQQSLRQQIIPKFNLTLFTINCNLEFDTFEVDNDDPNWRAGMRIMVSLIEPWFSHEMAYTVEGKSGTLLYYRPDIERWCVRVDSDDDTGEWQCVECRVCKSFNVSRGQAFMQSFNFSALPPMALATEEPQFEVEL